MSLSFEGLPRPPRRLKQVRPHSPHLSATVWKVSVQPQRQTGAGANKALSAQAALEYDPRVQPSRWGRDAVQ